VLTIIIIYFIVATLWLRIKPKPSTLNHQPLCKHANNTKFSSSSSVEATCRLRSAGDLLFRHEPVLTEKAIQSIISARRIRVTVF